MKKFAFIVAAAAAIFVTVPASAQDMHRDGMHQGGMHRAGMMRMHPHMRPHRWMRPPMRHRHHDHMMR